MVKIRLAKTGRKNAPAYRLVVMDSRKPRDSKSLDIIGFYNPSHNPVLFKYDEDKYNSWVKKGAQPTKSVTQLIKGDYVFIPYDREKLDKEKQEKAEAAEKEAEAKAQANTETENAEVKEESTAPAEEESATEETAKEKESPKE